MYRFAMMATVVSLILSTGCLAQEAKPKESPEQKAIRAYLKENLPTGKWEEVRWWPATALKSPDWKGWVAVRLKYRTANKFGATELYDDVFTIRSSDQKVSWHQSEEPLNINRERIFGK